MKSGAHYFCVKLRSHRVKTIQDSLKAMKFPSEFVNRVHGDFDLDTRSEFSSFSHNFLSPTEMSEMVLSESEKRKKPNPQLLRTTPGSDFFSVLSFLAKEQSGQVGAKSVNIV